MTKDPSHIYQKAFTVFLCAVVLTFFYLRPMKSPWHPFIAGDGLGYYAYLPAVFIYHDDKLDFKWFNKVYEANYVNKSFDNPEDNFLVKYGDKKINKYYQGLSFIWLPFFLLAHALAGIMHWPADGFSPPYQWAMALASLFYLVLALWYLRKFLLLLVDNESIATLVPVTIFFGTHLFPYSIFSNTLSHVYSLCFNVMTVYYLALAFKQRERFLTYLLSAVLCYVITVGIRPLNALIILLLPVFYSNAQEAKQETWRLKHVLLVVLVLLFVAYQTFLMYQQTHSLLPYTYAGESFDFGNGRFWEVLFSYRIGLLVYVPLILLSAVGLMFMPQKKYWIFFGFFMAMVFIYSAWWYWPINRRATIDYYFIPATFLAFALQALKQKPLGKIYAALILFSLCYYQLKNYQMQQGILDEFKTYKDIYWRHFFRLKKANMFLIEPTRIAGQQIQFFDFENKPADLPALSKFIQGEEVYRGKQALRLTPSNNFCLMTQIPYPAFFDSDKEKTLRFSLALKVDKEVKAVHAFIQFFNAEGKSMLDVPFYLHEDELFAGTWDVKEFGYDILESDSLKQKQITSIGLALWSPEAKANVYADDLKLESLLLNAEP